MTEREPIAGDRVIVRAGPLTREFAGMTGTVIATDDHQWLRVQVRFDDDAKWAWCGKDGPYWFGPLELEIITGVASNG